MGIPSALMGWANWKHFKGREGRREGRKATKWFATREGWKKMGVNAEGMPKEEEMEWRMEWMSSITDWLSISCVMDETITKLPLYSAMLKVASSKWEKVPSLQESKPGRNWKLFRFASQEKAFRMMIAEALWSKLMMKKGDEKIGISYWTKRDKAEKF